MAKVTYEHRYTVPYDAELIKDAVQLNAIQRHYDFTKWCKDNTVSPYTVDPQYSSDGITVSFHAEIDYCRFISYLETYSSLFLHN